VFVYALQSPSCSATTCTSGVTITCPTSAPTFPGGYFGYGTYSDSACTQPTSYYGVSGGCQNYLGLGYSATCSGNNVQWNLYSSGCSGSSSQVSYSTSCSSLAGIYYKGLGCSSGSSCFHESTEINYKGRLMNLSNLTAQEGADCHVPHTFEAIKGIKIETTCNDTLRLTLDHLVFTQRGIVQAGSIDIGDSIFRDMEETVSCKVTNVEEEYSNYFGLNCEESVVLANGYKTSTFGNYHLLPSLYMKYGSKLLGVKGASQLGDAIVNQLLALSLFPGKN